MPPPHLHPRSAATSTLFAGTLLASFVVVALPHVLPCPRSRKTYADSQRVQLDDNGQPIMKGPEAGSQKKQLQPSASKASTGATRTRSKAIEDEAILFRQLQEEAELLDKQARECPVPKPTGLIGRVLGFEKPQPPKHAGSKSAASGPG